jgi:hypothetical protein
VPLLLNVLTIIFVAGSVALLWVNLRSWRPMWMVPRSAKRGPASRRLDQIHLAGITEAEVAASRAAAEQCLDQAGRSTSRTEKEAWLRMGVQWIKLAESADRHGADRTKSPYRFSRASRALFAGRGSKQKVRPSTPWLQHLQ